MGQKVHPFGFRVGITEAHKSRWYAPKALYGELLVEDQRIREYCDKRLNRRPPFAAVSDIHIERTREELKVIIKTARPGLVIGPKGSEIDNLTADLQSLTGRNVSISCIETLRRLYVCDARVDSGPTMKRFQPKDRGRAHPIKKRTSQITVALEEY